MADTDVEQAARALAETYETASRGIIYEHTAGTPSAGRLAAEIKTLVEAQRTAGLEVGDADVAHVMRRVESATQSARSALPGDAVAFLQLLRRALKDPGDTPASLDPSAAPASGPSAATGSGLIVPGR
jgi:hypothetical protein